MVATVCSINFPETHSREIGPQLCLSVSSSFLNSAETLASQSANFNYEQTLSSEAKTF